MEKKRQAEQERINTLAMLLGAKFVDGVFTKENHGMAGGFPVNWSQYYDLDGNEITTVQAGVLQDAYRSQKFTWRAR